MDFLLLVIQLKKEIGKNFLRKEINWFIIGKEILNNYLKVTFEKKDVLETSIF